MQLAFLHIAVKIYYRIILRSGKQPSLSVKFLRVDLKLPVVSRLRCTWIVLCDQQASKNLLIISELNTIYHNSIGYYNRQAHIREFAGVCCICSRPLARGWHIHLLAGFGATVHPFIHGRDVRVHRNMPAILTELKKYHQHVLSRLTDWIQEKQKKRPRRDSNPQSSENG
jgi:hypothetical protein